MSVVAIDRPREHATGIGVEDLPSEMGQVGRGGLRTRFSDGSRAHEHPVQDSFAGVRHAHFTASAGGVKRTSSHTR